MTVQYKGYLHGIDTGQFAKNVDIYAAHFSELITTQNELYTNLNTHRILLYDILGDDTGVLHWKTNSVSYPSLAPFISKVETSFKSGGTPANIALKAFALVGTNAFAANLTIRFRSVSDTATLTLAGASYGTLSWVEITGLTSQHNTLDTFQVDALVASTSLMCYLYGAIIVEAF